MEFEPKEPDSQTPQHEDADGQTVASGEEAAATASAMSDVLGSGDGIDVAPRESKRATSTAMVMLMILAIGGGGLYFMYGKAGPASARGAEQGADVRKRVDNFLEGGASQLKTLEAGLRNTKKVVDQFRQYPAMNQVPLAELRVNPFCAQPAVAAPTVDPLAEAKKQHEKERAEAIKAVGALHLQSLLCADSRKACTIDGTVCHEGQQVEGFIIEKIEPQGVIVKRGGFRFELQFQR